MQYTAKKKYLTTNAWLLQFQSSVHRYKSMIKGQCSSIITPTIPSCFKELAQTRPSICWLYIYYPVQNQRMDAYIHWLADKCLWSLMDDNLLCFGFLRLTCSANPETAVTCTCGHFNQVAFAITNSSYISIIRPTTILNLCPLLTGANSRKEDVHHSMLCTNPCNIHCNYRQLQRHWDLLWTGKR